MIITGSDDSDIRLWSHRGRCVDKLVGHNDAVYSVCALSGVGIHPQGKELLISGGRDGDVRIWDMASRECIKLLKAAHESWILSVRPSNMPEEEGNGFITTSNDNTVKVWTARDESVACMHTFSGHQEGATRACMVNDIFVTTDNGDSITFWA